MFNYYAMIGALHLTLASLGCSANVNSLVALAHIGWICITWTMFLPLVLWSSVTVPAVYVRRFALGVVIVLL